MIIKSKYDLGQTVKFYRYEDVMYGRTKVNKKVEYEGLVVGLDSSIRFNEDKNGRSKELHVEHTYAMDTSLTRYHVDKSMVIGVVS